MWLVERWVARAITCVRVNRTTKAQRAGSSVYAKRRRLGAGAVIACGNVYLRVSSSRIQMFTRTSDWLAWESSALEALHPGVVAEASGRTLTTYALPGAPVRDRGRVHLDAMHAVGAELARAHACVHGGAHRTFSHGDAHLRNFHFDGRRAYLYDVETRHEEALASAERHADDLLVALLDLAAHAPPGDWQRGAEALLSGYGRGPGRAALSARLHVPRGLERVLWSTRTGHVSDARLGAMLESLRAIAA